MLGSRLIMYHKQSTSARTRFLKLAYGGVCGFAALAPHARVEDTADCGKRVVVHPAAVVREAETCLGLPGGSLEMEPSFRCDVSVGDDRIAVFLARFTDIDPPFATAQAHGGAFIDLTQARDLPAVELDLLRRSYERILG